MNFELSDDQQLMRDNFARFLDEHSSMARVRAAEERGFDAALWRGLGELGAFSLRVPEDADGLGMGVIDAAVLMEEAGRTLASGPLAETLIAARLLALLGGDANRELLDQLVLGESVVSLALHDASIQPKQWIAGGAVASAVIARDGDRIVLVKPAAQEAEGNLASTAIAEIDLADGERSLLSDTPEGLKVFAQGVEEWKLLIAAALAGLSRQALKMAAEYACERKAFGQPIGQYQAISHPMADLVTDAHGGKYLTWKTIHDIAHGLPDAAPQVSMTAWWNADTAARAVAHALHTFGGYGLTTEYDIYLYNLRAKAWPLVYGDPKRLLEEAGRRLYAGETAELPEVGEVPIDFDLGEEARNLGAEMDAFFNETLTPELRAKAHYSFDGFDAGFHKKMAEAKLLFPAWPPEFGGRNAPAYAMNAVMQVYENQGWSTHAVSTTSMVGHIIRRFGSDELKADALTRIVAGESICSLGYSEPGCGSDVFAAQCKATRDGDGWRIDGSKMFTSGANIADYVLMLTRTNTEVPKHKGLTMFIVPLKAEGVTIQPVYTFQDERTNITFYDGVKIPDSYRLGEVDGGIKVMAASLELEHSGGGFARNIRAIAKAAETLCRDITLDGKPLIETPDALSRLARSMTHVFLSEVISDFAMWAGVAKIPNQGYGPMGKLFSSEKFLTDARDLLDLTAPHSLADRKGPAHVLNEGYRHAQGTTIYGGTSEVHRSMIAERALGLPRSRG